METLLLIAFVLNIICSLIVAEMGKGRKVGYEVVFWISFFLSSIVGIIVVLASPKISSARYKVYLDEAEKAASNGETEKSISLYGKYVRQMNNDYINDKKNAEAMLARTLKEIDKMNKESYRKK